MGKFKKTNLLWVLTVCIEVMLLILEFKYIRRNSKEMTCIIFMQVYNQLMICSVLLPLYAILICINIKNNMYFSKLLNYGSRSRWISNIYKENLIVTIKYILLLLVPFSILSFVGCIKYRSIIDVIYIIFTIISYIVAFYALSFVIIAIKLKFNNDILAIISIILICILPFSIIDRIILSDISIFLNAGNFFVNYHYIWVYHEIAIVIMLIVTFLLFKGTTYLTKKLDLLWRDKE